MVEYIVDPKRLTTDAVTGIYVRAKHEDKWGSYDINTLTIDSLRAWLRSRGGANEWAENVVLMLLGHELSPAANT